MSYETQDLRHEWHRYYKEGSTCEAAYLVSHGRYDDTGFTSLKSPACIHFYTFHGHNLTTVEIFQVINYQSRIKTADKGIVGCKPKIATAILGKGGPCWNYRLDAWTPTEVAEFLSQWDKARYNDNFDLFMLTGGTDGLFSDAPNSTMNMFFEALNEANLTYEIIYFLCCRKTSDLAPRTYPGGTTPLYQQSNPYWKK